MIHRTTRLTLAVLAAAVLFSFASCADKAGRGEADGPEAGQSQTGSPSQTGTEPQSGDYWELTQAGVSVPVPAAYLEHRDKVYMEAAEELYADEGVSYGYVGFYPASYDEIGAMSEDEIYDLIGRASYPVMIFGIDGGRGKTELSSWLDGDGWDDPLELDEIGRAGNWTFFRAVFDAADAAEAYGEDGEIGGIARQVADSLADSAGFRFAEPEEQPPVSTTAEVGRIVSFSTEDVYGTPVTAEDLFSSNEITMVNVWSSWCPPCQAELPELAALNTRLDEKNCGVIGILYDAGDGTGLEDGIAHMEAAGVNYPVLIPDADIYTAFPIYAFPTTYFVDSNGEIVGESIVGAYVEKYEPAIDALLEGK